MTVKETSLRSALKAVGWRITAGIVTAITSYFFTGSLAAAAAIVGWDLCTKSVSLFVAERIWNRSNIGRDERADSKKRSLIKALAWRAFAAVNTFIGATLLNSGKAGVAGKIAGSDSVVKTVLFYLYERAWAGIAWGTSPAEAEEELVPDGARELQVCDSKLPLSFPTPSTVASDLEMSDMAHLDLDGP